MPWFVMKDLGFFTTRTVTWANVLSLTGKCRTMPITQVVLEKGLSLSTEVKLVVKHVPIGQTRKG